MKYTVKTRVRSYTQNTTITEQDFGGWQAVNTGTDDVMVNKITLEPGQGLDYTHLDPEVRWTEPIKIVIINAGGEVTLTQLLYKEVKGK